MNDPVNTTFAVHTRLSEGLLTLTVEGGLDLAGTNEFRSAVAEAIESEAAHIVVAFDDLAFIDSQGVTAVLEADSASRRDGDRLEFRGESGQVARVFEMTGVRQALDR